VLACLPQLLELLGNSEEVNGHSPKLDRVGAVVEGADHLLRALPQLHEAILQRVNLVVRPDDGTLGQPTALDGSAALIGSLATGPAAVPSTATDGAGFWKLPPAPPAISGRGAAAHHTVVAGRAALVCPFTHVGETNGPRPERGPHHAAVP
jgi:hypothetical protein